MRRSNHRRRRSFTSPIAVWEAALALSRPDRLGLSVENSSAIVRLFLEDTGVEVRQLPPPEITLAGSIEAAARFRNRKQRLNLADCFHYAMAKHHNATMLSTANEFRFTDLETVP